MRIVAQGIEEEHIETGQALHAGGRDAAVIGQVGAIAETEAVAEAFAMFDADGSYWDSGSHKGIFIEDMTFEARTAGFARRGFEDIREGGFNGSQSTFGSKDGDTVTLQEVEGANVVEAKDVVGVRVGEEHRIQAFDSGAEGLIAQVGRGIDQDARVVELEQHGGAQAFVARIGRQADFAVAADHGDTDAGAGAEN